MKKKSLLLSLACAMLILLFGMTANAQSEDTLEPYSYTNPACMPIWNRGRRI